MGTSSVAAEGATTGDEDIVVVVVVRTVKIEVQILFDTSQKFIYIFFSLSFLTCGRLSLLISDQSLGWVEFVHDISGQVSVSRFLHLQNLTPRVDVFEFRRCSQEEGLVVVVISVGLLKHPQNVIDQNLDLSPKVPLHLPILRVGRKLVVIGLQKMVGLLTVESDNEPFSTSNGNGHDEAAVASANNLSMVSLTV